MCQTTFQAMKNGGRKWAGDETTMQLDREAVDLTLLTKVSEVDTLSYDQALLKLWCDDHTNLRSHCSFSVTITPMPPFAL